MSFFSKIRIEFPGNEYQPINWSKAKHANGSQNDCISIKRPYTAATQR